MSRTVLLTGSAGHLGRALREAFEAQGDRVIGVDTHDADMIMDLDKGPYVGLGIIDTDVLICNAKCQTWDAHHFAATKTNQCIVNIGSIYGVLGNDPRIYEGTAVPPTPAWYSAAKGAIVGLTKWQATNLAPIRSNCVCPGGIFRDHEGAFVDRYAARIPLGRMATESDVVPAVLFLASDAASYITGQVLMVDGGLSAW